MTARRPARPDRSGPGEGPGGSGASGRRRYRFVARGYDLLSGEWPVYGPPRRAGLDLLAPAPGEHVLDVACGTGLNLPRLADAVGPSGRVVGLDASAAMLARAAARAAAADWGETVRLHRRDLGAPVTGLSLERPVDAVVFSYALSVITDWRAAFGHALDLAAPDARLLILDLALPDRRAAWARPAARLACALGGSQIRREPWRILPEAGTVLRHEVYRGGHVHAVLARRGTPSRDPGPTTDPPGPG